MASPYSPPSSTVADPPMRSPLVRSEIFLRWVLFVNVVAGTGFITVAFIGAQSDLNVFVFASYAMLTLGFASAYIMPRRPILGLLGGAVFYLPQMVSYYTASGAWFFQAGFNITVSMPGASGTWVFNVLAMGLALGHVVAAVLYRERKLDEAAISAA